MIPPKADGRASRTVDSIEAPYRLGGGTTRGVTLPSSAIAMLSVSISHEPRGTSGTLTHSAMVEGRPSAEGRTPQASSATHKPSSACRGLVTRQRNQKVVLPSATSRGLRTPLSSTGDRLLGVSGKRGRLLARPLLTKRAVAALFSRGAISPVFGVREARVSIRVPPALVSFCMTTR